MENDGELLSNPRHVRADCKLIESGIRNGWQIPEKAMSFVPAKLIQIMHQGSQREQIAAARVLVAMQQQLLGPAPAPVVQVGVQVNGGSAADSDGRRTATLAIAERIRAKRIS